MQYEMQVFHDSEAQDFRVVDIEGEPWFVLADVCRKLDLREKNGSFSHHAERLDEDERRTVPASVLKGTSPSGREVKLPPYMLVINESGLYSLILRSDKPEAKKFKKWVTSEVLPSIRRTGGFGGRGVPAFIRRYNHNWNRIEQGHFSVLSELVVRLWGRLEQFGLILKDKSATGIELRPDVSVGLGFSKWLKKVHPNLEVPNSVWPLFVEYVDTSTAGRSPPAKPGRLIASPHPLG